MPVPITWVAKRTKRAKPSQDKPSQELYWPMHAFADMMHVQGKLFCLESIGSDGRASIIKIAFDGTCTGARVSVKSESLIEDYKPYPRGPPRNLNFDNRGPLDSEDWIVQAITFEIMAAVAKLTEDLGRPNITVMENPKGVFANEAYPRGELNIVPATNKVKTCLKELHGTMPFNTPTALEDMLKVGGDLPSSHTFYLSAPAGLDMLNAISFLQKMPANKVNMKVVRREVELQSKVHTSAAEKKRITVPFLQNSKQVPKGTELLIVSSSAEAPKASSERPFDAI